MRGQSKELDRRQKKGSGVDMSVPNVLRSYFSENISSFQIVKSLSLINFDFLLKN
jgi:hypothetical protein